MSFKSINKNADLYVTCSGLEEAGSMDGPSHEDNQHTGSLKPDGYIIIQENDLISGFDNTVGIANNRFRRC
ncbi:hypothetical protein KD5_15320 [Yersinia pseudotuberculosis]|nr:hypothetical protein YP72344_14560 [Yersinia pseudotuberculosis]BET62078.1 hypothetical protein YPSE1_15370 [Yersinia pseudotuberculosis]